VQVIEVKFLGIGRHTFTDHSAYLLELELISVVLSFLLQKYATSSDENTQKVLS